MVFGSWPHRCRCGTVPLSLLLGEIRRVVCSEGESRDLVRRREWLLVDLRHLVLSSQGYLSSSSLRKQRFLYQISASLLFVLDVPLPATPVRRLWRRTCLVVAAKLACFLAVRFGDGSSGMGLGFKCFVALCTCPDLVAVARPRALLHKRHGKSRHPRQQGEPHILVMFVKGGEQ
ncbi:unnamed protein product [Brassica napus]|uniref:(rape) hypothetical protein n=1 Tax=Brassica napus TaxID=3708 RepID=A0A816L865_BRANA|nr:unnamed protein product [Brassica napus]